MVRDPGFGVVTVLYQIRTGIICPSEKSILAINSNDKNEDPQAKTIRPGYEAGKGHKARSLRSPLFIILSDRRLFSKSMHDQPTIPQRLS